LTTAEKVANRQVAQTAAQSYVEQTVNTDFVSAVPDTQPQLNIVGKINLFLQKEVIAGTKIKWMHLAIVAVAFVAYVELVANRQQKRKLKFW